MKKEYRYGTRFRPAGIGCQPTDGLLRIDKADKQINGYHSVVVYDRELSEGEIRRFELIDLNWKNACEYPKRSGRYEVINNSSINGGNGIAEYDINDGWIVPKMIKSFYKILKWRPCQPE